MFPTECATRKCTSSHSSISLNNNLFWFSSNRNDFTTGGKASSPFPFTKGVGSQVKRLLTFIFKFLIFSS